MTMMTIEVSKVSPVRMEGKFPKMDIVFMRDGKANNRTLAGVGKTKEVLNILKEAKEGDIFDIELVKSPDDKYWNWEGAKKAEGQVKQEAAKTSYNTKSTYETPEERAKKQVYIIRQSSLSTANDYHIAQGKKFSTGELKETAQELIDFVFQVGQTGSNVKESMDRATKLAEKAAAEVNKDKDFEDDLPF